MNPTSHKPITYIMMKTVTLEEGTANQSILLMLSDKGGGRVPSS